MIAVLDFDELCRDAQMIARLAHATLEYRLDAQLSTDLPDINGARVKAKRGGSGGNINLSYSRQGIENLLCDSFAKVALVFIGTHIREWQHGD